MLKPSISGPRKYDDGKPDIRNVVSMMNTSTVGDEEGIVMVDGCFVVIASADESKVCTI